MTDRSPSELPPYRETPPSAVVDIGSNSIRLVVYETSDRAPLPIFNEKLLCGLGRGLDATGNLAPEGVERALEALPRFMDIVDAMGVARVDLLATAAVREARNGQDFVDRAAALCHRPVEVLSGSEEARLSGLGVLSGTTDADGVMGDLGGGSVELVEIGRDGDGHALTGDQVTLPLGPLRLDPKVVSRPAKAGDIVSAGLDGVEWLSRVKGRNFYAVGGAWRSFARLHMIHTGYPLHVLHHYTIRGEAAVEFANFVAKLSPDTLQKVHGVSKRRIETLPYASMLLGRILERTRPPELIFSANGLREGCLFNRLDEDDRLIDPLLAACRNFAQHSRLGDAKRGPGVDGDQLFAWIEGVLHDASDEEKRLKRAACLLADISRWEHPDYRAEHALMRVMRLPIVGIDHWGRAFLGLAVASRHAQVGEETSAMQNVIALLDEQERARARAIGLAIRLAYTVSGGTLSLLSHFRLERTDGSLKLHVPDDHDHLVGEVVERRLKSLCKALKIRPKIVRYNDTST